MESRKRRALELLQEAYREQMRGQLEQAVQLYTESLAAYPTAEAHTFLGWTYSFLERLDDAIEECKKAGGSMCGLHISFCSM